MGHFNAPSEHRLMLFWD